MKKFILKEFVQNTSFPVIAPLCASLGVQLTLTSIAENLECSNTHISTIAALSNHFSDIDVIFPIMNTSLEAGALGCPIEYKGGRPVVTGHPYTTDAEIENITIPDPYSVPCMKTNIEIIQQLSSLVDKPVAAYIVGPVTLAVHLMGINTIAFFALKDGDSFLKMIDLCSEMLLPYANGLAQAGASVMIVLEPQIANFSPSIYDTLIKNKLEEFVKGLPNPVLHVCGDVTRFIPYFAATRYFAGLSLDAMVDFEECLKTYGKLNNKVLIGNIDPVSIMYKGKKTEIKEKVSKLLAAMKGRLFILSTGCDMVPDTPFENLDAFIEAALEYRCQFLKGGNTWDQQNVL